MKILYWTPMFWPEIGGIEIQAVKTLPLLRDRGHDLIVVASHGSTTQPDKTNHNGISVYRYPFWTSLVNGDLGLIRRVREDVSRLKQEFEPDLLHVNFSGYTAYFQLLTAHICPAPMVIRLASSLDECDAGPDTVLGRLLAKADWIAAVSEATLADARHVMPDIAQRSSTIYIGLAPPLVEPAPLPLDYPRILCFGRLVREKGFDLALKAFGILIKRYPRLSLTIVGDGPEREHLERQVDQMGLQDGVEFTGMVPNNRIPHLINTATFVVVPSRYREPLGLVNVEAAQMARPIVASRVGGIPESVIDRETGILFENENVEALIEAVVFLLDHSEEAEKMGQAGRKRALKVFGFERYVDEYDALYSKVHRHFLNRHSHRG